MNLQSGFPPRLIFPQIFQLSMIRESPNESADQRRANGSSLWVACEFESHTLVICLGAVSLSALGLECELTFRGVLVCIIVPRCIPLTCPIGLEALDRSDVKLNSCISLSNYKQGWCSVCSLLHYLQFLLKFFLPCFRFLSPVSFVLLFPCIWVFFRKIVPECLSLSKVRIRFFKFCYNCVCQAFQCFCGFNLTTLLVLV